MEPSSTQKSSARHSIPRKPVRPVINPFMSSEENHASNRHSIVHSSGSSTNSSLHQNTSIPTPEIHLTAPTPTKPRSSYHTLPSQFAEPIDLANTQRRGSFKGYDSYTPLIAHSDGDIDLEAGIGLALTTDESSFISETTSTAYKRQSLSTQFPSATQAGRRHSLNNIPIITTNKSTIATIISQANTTILLPTVTPSSSSRNSSPGASSSQTASAIHSLAHPIDIMDFEFEEYEDIPLHEPGQGDNLDEFGVAVHTGPPVKKGLGERFKEGVSRFMNKPIWKQEVEGRGRMMRSVLGDDRAPGWTWGNIIFVMAVMGFLFGSAVLVVYLVVGF